MKQSRYVAEECMNTSVEDSPLKWCLSELASPFALYG